MIIYRTTKGERDVRGFDLTVNNAHRRARITKMSDKNGDDVWVDQLNLDPSRKNVIDLLNGDDIHTELKPLRSWRVSNRGGLEEVPVK